MTSINNDKEAEDRNNSRMAKDREINVFTGFGAVLGILLIAYSSYKLLETIYQYVFLIGVAIGFAILGVSFIKYGTYFKKALFSLFGGIAVAFSLIPAGIFAIMFIAFFFLSRASR